MASAEPRSLTLEPGANAIPAVPVPFDRTARRAGRRTRLLASGLVLAVSLLATFLRQQGVPKVHTIWAEDGSEFATCAYAHGLLDCLARPYDGYLHVVPRLGADLAVMGAPADLPLHLALLAGIVASLAAVLVALAVLDVTASGTAAVMAGTALVLVWPAAVEVSGNLTNLHWMLLVASIVVVLTTWLGRTPGFADLGLLVATCLSSPIAPLMLPPLALVPVALRAPRARTMLAVLLVASAPQLLLVAGSERAADAYLPALPDLVDWTVRAIRDWTWFGPRQTVANLLLPLATVAIVIGLARARKGRVLVLVVTMVGLGAIVLLVSMVSNQRIAPRYVYVLAALAAIAVALGTAALAGRLQPRAGGALLAGVALVLAAGAGATFVTRTYATDGPDVVAQIEACDRTRSDMVEVITSPIVEPQRWRLWVPCR